MDTRDRISKTSFNLFLEYGFSDVSVNEIIKATGITKGGFYHYFKSKEELIYDTIDKFFCPFFEIPLMQMRFDFKKEGRFKDANEKLKYFYMAVPSFTMQNRPMEHNCDNDLRKFYFLLFEGIKKYKYMEDIKNKYYKEKIDILENIIEDGKNEKLFSNHINTHDWAVTIIALKDGMMSLNFLEESIDIKQKCLLSYELIWEEIRAKD